MSIPDDLRAALAGRYAVERELGAGGMASVYLAEDLKHHRKVAIKVLHPELSAVLGPERFLKEIELTASLQHPHILPLFDSGNADGLLYYVMPYVEGESLRDRLERERQLPVQDAVRIAEETADALQYAHERGVVHRDIKPENILLQNGHVAVADFGIALAVQHAGAQRLTATGLSLGTPQYMAPEQAMGERNVDQRADIYALGAVTYEMLAGEPPFTGPNGQAIIAKLLTAAPRPVRTARPSVPAHVDAAITRALEKLPADRWTTAHELTDALEGRGRGDASAAPAEMERVRTPQSALPTWLMTRGRRRILLALGAAVLLGVGAAAGALWRARSTPAPRVAYLSLTLGPGQQLTGGAGRTVAFSPDGRALAYLANAPGRPPMLYYRPLDGLTARALPGTENAQGAFFSPDGRWLGFFDRSTTPETLKKVSTTAGAATVVAKIQGIAGGAWGPGDVILFGSRQGLWRVSALGGAAELLTRTDSAHGEVFHAMPRFLPDGRTVAFAVLRTGSVDSTRLGLVSLRSGARTTLDLPGDVPLGFIDGHLIVGRDAGAVGELAAVPLDLSRRRITGPPVTVLSGMSSAVAASLADGGSLAFIHGALTPRLILLDEQGNAVGGPPLTKTLRLFYFPRLSPDGRRIAVAVRGGTRGGTFDIWVFDIASGVLSRATSRGTAFYPGWTPDGRLIAYVASVASAGANGTTLWSVPSDGSGSEQLIYALPAGFSFDYGPTFTPDGETIVEEVTSSRTKRHELWKLTRSPGGAWKGGPFLQTDFDVEDPRLSPDGHWLAYASNETGRFETYVRPFPGPGGRVQISSGGGSWPAWSPDGQKLYGATDRENGQIRVARLRLMPSLDVAGAGAAFPAGHASDVLAPGGFDVRPDGKGFVVVGSPAGAPDRGIVVVLNWREELRRKLAAAGR